MVNFIDKLLALGIFLMAFGLICQSIAEYKSKTIKEYLWWWGRLQFIVIAGELVELWCFGVLLLNQ